MSSGKGDAQPRKSGVSSSTKGDFSDAPKLAVNQVTDGVGGMSLDNVEDGWEVFTKKNKNKAGSSFGKSTVPPNPPPKAWGNPDGQRAGIRSVGSGKGLSNAWGTQPGDFKGTAGRGNTSYLPPNSYNAWPAPIAPPMQHGWNSAKPASTLFKDDATSKPVNVSFANLVDDKDVEPVIDGEENESDEADDFDDDELLSDDYDSDESQKSHGTRKQNRWFVQFFKVLDTLTVEQINEPTRQWHCPACQNGPGSIDWYRLQPLITHAKTKGSTRVKLHRELAELLDEELHRRGTSAIAAGEAFGKWRGLVDEVKDKDIVWPPMVFIMNTQLEKDDNDKWIGMGNQELLDYFSSYAATKARHSYGPQGHRGMSVLVFEASAVGYLEAERLSKHFEDEGTHREAWDHRRVLFQPGGKRQLYGFMAQKGDLDLFNRHSPGKTKLKYDIRSYQEMVVNQMKQMNEDNQQLIWFKNRVVKEQRHSKALAESFGIVSEKLRKTMQEQRIVRQKTKLHHEQNKEEMDYQEQFFKEQIEIMHKAREAREDDFEKIQQEEREKVKQSCVNPALVEDPRRRGEKYANFVKLQDEAMLLFEDEREKAIKEHEEKKLALKQKHLMEEVELEKDFDAVLNQLMEKYTPCPEGKLPEEKAGSVNNK